MANPDASTIKPALPNLPTPPSIKVERTPSGHVNSPNAAGGEIPAGRYSTKSK